jgi:hypothetical protein
MKSHAGLFYAMIIVPTLIGMLVNFVGINPIRALFWTAVINGFLAPKKRKTFGGTIALGRPAKGLANSLSPGAKAAQPPRMLAQGPGPGGRDCYSPLASLTLAHRVADRNGSEQGSSQDEIGDAEVDDETGHVYEGGHERRGGAGRVEAQAPEDERQHRADEGPEGYDTDQGSADGQGHERPVGA